MNKITVPVAKSEERLETTQEVNINASLEIENKNLKNSLAEKEHQLDALAREITLLKEQIEQIETEKDESEDTEELLSYLLQEIRDGLDTAFHGFTTEMADILSVSLAKILGEALVDKEIALSVIRNVIEQENLLDILQVRVSARDFELVSNHSNFDDLQKLHFVPDLSVETGGCILQLRSGLVDGRVDVQLKSLTELMKMAIN